MESAMSFLCMVIEWERKQWCRIKFTDMIVHMIRYHVVWYDFIWHDVVMRCDVIMHIFFVFFLWRDFTKSFEPRKMSSAQLVFAAKWWNKSQLFIFVGGLSSFSGTPLLSLNKTTTGSYWQQHSFHLWMTMAPFQQPHIYLGVSLNSCSMVVSGSPKRW